ncbi:MAG: type II toxin-antitoxin system RelE/ParE family toxin [Bryobacterales bacterium]|nr:type II toxin-antitoxin system RelE/ParE family toxin [Bryobacterales bacterium]
MLTSSPNEGGPASRPTGIRVLIHSPFRVYYRIKPSLRRVDILHVWHGRRRGPYS